MKKEGDQKKKGDQKDNPLGKKNGAKSRDGFFEHDGKEKEREVEEENKKTGNHIFLVRLGFHCRIRKEKRKNHYWNVDAYKKRGSVGNTSCSGT